MDAKAVRNFITSSSRDSSHNGEGAPSESGESFLYCLAGTAGREAQGDWLIHTVRGKENLGGSASLYCAAGEAGSLGGMGVG